MTLARFYPIFDSPDWIARAVGLGVRLVQLRIKDQPEEAVRAVVRAALAVCEAHGATLVVNDYWRIAIEEGAPFVHLGQEDLDTADRAAIARAGVKLGLSTHDDAELDRALAAGPDYVALGPIFPTILKAMKWREQGIAKLTAWKARVGAIPLCAIGGMRVETAPDAFAAGADLVSAVTDITLNPDPDARIRAWLEACG
jgi:thiamine-phosphate pyrophosphorylase